MIHTKKKVRFACGLGAAMLGVGLAVVACGGDDTTVSPGGGTDASTDGTVPGDGGLDATGDSSLDGSRDGGNTGDGGLTDGSTDGGDASLAAELTSFANSIYTASCTNLKTACAAFDAGAGNSNVVDIPTCVAGETQGGFIEGSTAGTLNPGVQSRNTVTVDPQLQQRCLAAIQQLDFSQPITSAAYLTATTDCFSVVQGTVPVGSPCYASIECLPHAYCELGQYDAGTFDAGDAGDAQAPPTGLCEPILDAGSSCTNYQSGESCSTRGSQLDNSFCDLADFGGTNTCTSGFLSAGDECPYDLACSTGICGPDDTKDPTEAMYYCLSSLDFRQVLCTAYNLPTP
jgi:hypothetical protein